MRSTAHYQTEALKYGEHVYHIITKDNERSRLPESEESAGHIQTC